MAHWARLPLLCVQVEYLQQTNKALEDEVVTVTTGNDELVAKVEDHQSKQAAMMRELANFDRLARDLQQEKLSAKAEGQRELRKDKANLARQNAVLADKLSSAQAALNDNTRLQGESQHLVSSLSQSEREIERLQSHLDLAADNNKRLEVHCQKLQAKEMELARALKQSGKDPAVFVGAASAGAGGGGGVTSRVFRSGPQGGGAPDHAPSPPCSQCTQLQAELSDLGAVNTNLQQVFQSVEREREFYKNRANSGSGSDSGHSHGSRHQYPTKPDVVHNDVLERECQRYKFEIQALTDVVHRLELQLRDTSLEVAQISAEREDLLALLYQQGEQQQQQQRAGKEASGHGHTHDSSSATYTAAAHGAPEASIAAAEREWRAEKTELLAKLAATTGRATQRVEALESQVAQSLRQYQDADDKAKQLESLLLSKMPQADDASSGAYRRQIDELQNALREANQNYDEASRQTIKLVKER